LKPGGRGLTVVGDDAQSIYSFRAATVRNILDFPEQFSPKAEIVTLDRNYRSTQPILSAANGVIDLARERFTKNLWTDRISSAKPRLVAVGDEADQARYIVEQILENREEGALLKQQAVLFRTSSHSGPLEVELTRRNIPFVKFGGLKFLDAAHVKDVLALLRFVANPRDRVAGFRVLHLLPGIGPASAQRILDQMAEATDPLSALCSLPARPAQATTGLPSSERSETSDIRSGRLTLNVAASGTSRILSASTKTPRFAAPISSSSSRSLAGILRVNAFSPNSPWIHRMRPAIRQASLCWMRTT
jgi:superfamily I DNA/RNA helicase